MEVIEFKTGDKCFIYLGNELDDNRRFNGNVIYSTPYFEDFFGNEVQEIVVYFDNLEYRKIIPQIEYKHYKDGSCMFKGTECIIRK